MGGPSSTRLDDLRMAAQKALALGPAAPVPVDADDLLTVLDENALATRTLEEQANLAEDLESAKADLEEANLELAEANREIERLQEQLAAYEEEGSDV